MTYWKGAMNSDEMLQGVVVGMSESFIDKKIILLGLMPYGKCVKARELNNCSWRKTEIKNE